MASLNGFKYCYEIHVMLFNCNLCLHQVKWFQLLQSSISTQLNSFNNWYLTLVILFIKYFCPVGWDCRIHWLHLCRGIRPPHQRVSWIWHKTLWWWSSSDAGALGNAEYFFIAIAPRPLWVGVVAPDRTLSMN